MYSRSSSDYLGYRVNPIDVSQLCESFDLKVKVGCLLVLLPSQGRMKISDLE